MQMEHELDPESNDLAAKAFDIIDRARPHATTILAVVAAALLAALGWALISSQVAVGREQSWNALLSAFTSNDRMALQESLGSVIRRYPATPAAQWAEIVLADLAVSDGTDLLFVDRDRATQRLQAAVGSYSSVLATRPTGMIAERATFGLAKARESLGQLEEARRGYDVVAREQASAGLKRLAADRAEALGRESTRQWYDWFAAQKVSPPQPPAAGNAAEPGTAVNTSNAVKTGAAPSPDEPAPKTD